VPGLGCLLNRGARTRVCDGGIVYRP
jgi:hypothetical protein